ncbi:unnamed protein product [Clavelina lepadiformis]|uniref:Cytochrome P450 n=1 Tax=Clavelina lepadiformis TaxID=159417 RepID=A0ABP0F2A0_CLALP
MQFLNISSYFNEAIVTLIFRSLAFSVIVFILIHKWLKRPRNFPPGPIGLPVIGIAHKITNRAEVALMKLSWKHGPIMGIKLLRQFTVVFSDFEVLQQTLVKQGQIFSGRPTSIMFETFTRNRGVLAIDGPRWRENRRFTAATIRRFFSSKQVLEEKMVDEMIAMARHIQTIRKKPFDFSDIITHTVSNILCNLAFGERFEFNDNSFLSKARAVIDWFNGNSNKFTMLVMAPYLRFLPPFDKCVQGLRKACDELVESLKPIVHQHKEGFDFYEIRDFVDAYFQEIEKNKDQPNSFYKEAELMALLRDLFVAGTDTTVTTFRWTIIYLINRPHVQRKIQREIDRVIGPDARPKASHMYEMHYTQAVMQEMFRIRPAGPLGLTHRTTEATKVMGYDIPKNTQVLTNFWAVHHDPKVWGDPEVFRPERFLDDEGKFHKPSNVLTFSLGSRHCLGENFAWIEYFFFLVILLQRFHLYPEPDDVEISEECPRSGQFLIAPSHKIRVKERFSRTKSIREFQEAMNNNCS